ncbi:unnamed protein product [Malassezia sympodialis ATCC 42132]|uniref:Similar to S.cerevisiae protein XPT1 (Xanthine-guanine phosphoribosyl transferase) n=1 Tax=Malassezia sympodialis (strain ATCC 42132) TaxID=1230383 RepID=M5ELA9_MALS4|nr:uncharacterized protein MSY001_1105 [Malassezia sympodialis ATCC 42132]CCU98399.1 unnamed protein product [Malassezia sympodialis ATCC 42132]SHO75777.1 Similar to S.cerevisiae protein XPT1 (Xanthine-guanine phosphoribosyl transferase) [Malassezia sympodialis ATCC 42132]|eukprot:XP_018739706.1 uncharacterized protein MSY001_1105 [Malassezia sympodialis ATCC 42132]
MSDPTGAAASSPGGLPDDHWRPTYEDIHVMIRHMAEVMREEFQPDLLVAIGGGGFFPARVLRTFLKKRDEKHPGKMRNVPIQAIGLSLYEEVDGVSEEQIGTEVIRTQWLDTARRVTDSQGRSDAGGLLGKNVLIVDEVDDSRTTLHYAYHELLKDVKKALESYTPEERAELPPTRFGVFVVHNKRGPKRAELPVLASPADDRIVDGVSTGVYYYAAETTPPVWIDFPWEQTDIVEHNRLAALAQAQGRRAGAPPPGGPDTL